MIAIENTANITAQANSKPINTISIIDTSVNFDSFIFIVVCIDVTTPQHIAVGRSPPKVYL